jgi:protein O-mannosyl-transferase
MSAASPTPTPVRRASALWISLGLVAITLLVYWRVTGFEFVTYDDPDFITSNPHVQAGLTASSFKWAWHSNVARNWHPVTMLTHMLDCQLYQLKAGRHHLTNLLIHVANTLLLFYVLRLMTGAMWRSAFIAALFAVHPLHVESVAWIAERKDVLSTFFLFLTFWAYVRYAQSDGMRSSKGGGFYALALLFFALGLLSKPMIVTAPFVLLLLDYWPLRRLTIPGRKTQAAAKTVKKNAPALPAKPFFPIGVVVEKIPFLIMSAVLCVVTYSIQQSGGAMQTGRTMAFKSCVENALVSYVRYMGKMFWPRRLAALYLRNGDWPVWSIVACAVVLLAMSILVIRQARRRPWLAVGWFWYLGTLVPVIGIVQVGMQTMADRFTYVPLLGLFIILTWGACELAGKWEWPKTALAGAAVASIMACMALTVRQVGYWKDSETLFKRMIDVTKNNFMAHYNLANVYAREKRYDEADANYIEALQEEPNYADAHNNYAGLLLEEKRYDQAVREYGEAYRINPQFLYLFNYANAMADTASARHDAGEFAEAVRAFKKAQELNPASSDAHHNLAMTWDAQGKPEEAVLEYREVIRLDPSSESAHYNLANDLAHLNKLEEAASEYRGAIQLNPRKTEYYNGLGICYAMQNKIADAVEQFQQALRLQPDNAAANGNMGNALAAENRIDESIPYYLAALRADPNDAQTEFNLGLTYYRQRKPLDAVAHLKQALRIDPNNTQARAALEQVEKESVNQK